MWLALRGRPEGLKFRRQHPCGPYIADFYCHAARLVIEVDGAAHDYGDRPARDAARDAWFAVRNIAVLRLAASDVFRDLDAVLSHILNTAKDRMSRDQSLADIASSVEDRFHSRMIAIGVAISIISSVSASLAAIAVDHLLHG